MSIITKYENQYVRSRLRFRRGPRDKRAGISEILGSLIMIAITLVAGAAVFGFVNGQTASSSQAVGNSAAQNVNFLNEKESVVLAQMIAGTPPTATIYVYNSGTIDPLAIASVIIIPSIPPSPVCTINYPTPFTNTIQKLKVASVPVDLSQCTKVVGGVTVPDPNPFTFARNNTYSFEVIGQYGSQAQLTVRF